jgi:hypothetical protein
MILILILLILFGGGFGWYGYRQGGAPWGGGILGTVLVIIVVLWLLGRL